LAAYALARTFYEENVRSGAPLPVQGAAAWHAGTLAATAAYEHPADAVAYNRNAFDLDRAAVAADPLQVGYQLALGVSALKVGDAGTAGAAYRAAIGVAPQSFDAYAGLAVAAASAGDCDAARRADERARQLGGQQGRGMAQAVQGYPPADKAAFHRCVGE
jgi:Flp pilus assembly protein TadD